MNFYLFDQNNSGGTFDVDKNVAHRVVIEAETEEDAVKKFQPLIENQSGSCPCCGDRWSLYCEAIELEKYKNSGYPVSVYTSDKDYKSKWDGLYGFMPIKSAPKLIKGSWGNRWGGVINIETIDQYLQILTNEHAWTTPDCIIHFADGTKKQIFKTEIKLAGTI